MFSKIHWGIICLLYPCLCQSQAFNKRFDAFGWGFEQTALGIEGGAGGFTICTTSSDCDSISPTECFFHGSVLLTRIDAYGNVLWEKRSWRPNHTAVAGWANCCDTIPGGGFIVGGASEAPDGSDEIYLMRFDANGDTLWTRVFGDPTLNRFWIGYQVRRTSEGGFLVVGSTDQYGSPDGFALKTDSEGNEEWRRTYGWSTTLLDGLGSVDLAANGELFMGGTHWVDDVDKQLWVQRTTELGTLIWRVSWGGPWSDGSAVIHTLLDGHILVASGLAADDAGNDYTPYLAKLDSTDGEIIWEREYGSANYRSVLFAGKECSGGDIIACGVTNANGDQQGLLLRTTAEGDSLWMRSYYYQDEQMNDGEGRFYDVLPTPDGGFIAAGAAYGSASGNNPPGLSQDTWVVKVDGDGCIVPGCDGVGITEQATNLLGALTILPNPAHGNTTVRLQLPNSVANGVLDLSIVAMDGKLVHQQRITGNGEHTLALEQLMAGVYHIHIAAAKKWLTGGKLLIE
ncbi:MAG TPA: T9SS type A sorting domain-containing protein [Flavobacteriales bacterium]|nr:T9SS type A sorting domain-containing protein [Flavobacteriales bacterium]